MRRSLVHGMALLAMLGASGCSLVVGDGSYAVGNRVDGSTDGGGPLTGFPTCLDPPASLGLELCASCVARRCAAALDGTTQQCGPSLKCFAACECSNSTCIDDCLGTVPGTQCAPSFGVLQDCASTGAPCDLECQAVSAVLGTSETVADAGGTDAGIPSLVGAWSLTGITCGSQAAPSLAALYTTPNSLTYLIRDGSMVETSVYDGCSIVFDWSTAISGSMLTVTATAPLDCVPATCNPACGDTAAANIYTYSFNGPGTVLTLTSTTDTTCTGSGLLNPVTLTFVEEG